MLPEMLICEMKFNEKQNDDDDDRLFLLSVLTFSHFTLRTHTHTPTCNMQNRGYQSLINSRIDNSRTKKNIHKRGRLNI